MSHVSLPELQVWAERSKLNFTQIDSDLDEAISASVLSRLAPVYNTATWTTSTATPSLVRKIIAMEYVSWKISAAYAGDETESDYALRLLGMAESLIAGLVAGTTVLTDATDQPVNDEQASFYPNDSSSALEPTCDDRSLGGPVFTMGVLW